MSEQSDMQRVLSEFVKDGWTIVSQSPDRVSLQKKPNSRGLAILLGAISLVVLVFVSALWGVVCLVATLLLVALNNATKKTETAFVSVTPNGTVNVVSSAKRVTIGSPQA